MLLDEFKVIRSAVSAEQLNQGLKSEQLEQFGEAFSPQLVYETIRGLPRFADMKVRLLTTCKPEHLINRSHSKAASRMRRSS